MQSYEFSKLHIISITIKIVKVLTTFWQIATSRLACLEMLKTIFGFTKLIFFATKRLLIYYYIPFFSE